MLNGKIPPYNDPEFVEYRTSRIIELSNDLTPILNNCYEICYSQRFWGILLNSYLKTCLNRENILSRPEYKARNFFLEVNSRIIPGRIERINTLVRYIPKYFYKGVSYNTVINVLHDNDNIAIGQRASYHERKGIGKELKPYYPFSLYFDYKLRNRLNIEGGKQKNIFKQNVIKELPFYYVEWFRYIYNKIEVFNPKNKIFHYEHLASPFEKYLLAKYQEHGASIKMYQTGGFVGEVKFSPNKVLYDSIDKFVTYGWENHEKDIPGRAYRLEEYYSKWEESVSEIDKPEFDIMIVLSVADEYTRPHYKKFYDLLISKINNKKYKNILLRPRPKSRLLNMRTEYEYLKIHNNVTVDKASKPMYLSAANTKLIVIPQAPSTNFLECVYCGQPVVVLDTNNAPSKTVEKHYRNLKELKVMFDSPQELIDHINVMDIDSWWLKTVRDERFKNFAKEFAGKT